MNLDEIAAAVFATSVAGIIILGRTRIQNVIKFRLEMFKSTITERTQMSSDSMASFVNGIIAGAGAVLAIMSYAFMQMTSPLEGVMGFTTTEIRVAILLGGMVCAVAVGYEFYRKKEIKKQNNQDQKKEQEIEKEKTQKTEIKEKDVTTDE